MAQARTEWFDVVELPNRQFVRRRVVETVMKSLDRLAGQANGPTSDLFQVAVWAAVPNPLPLNKFDPETLKNLTNTHLIGLSGQIDSDVRNIISAATFVRADPKTGVEIVVRSPCAN